MNEPLISLHLIDYIVVLAYLGATMLIGMWFSKSIHSQSDFFLAGRSLPWWAVGFSLVATDIGGTDIVGLGGAAHKYGIAAANFDWIGCVPAMLVGAFVFIPHFWHCGITTIPELLERRFDYRVRTAVSLSWFLFMACNLGVMLVASARFMSGLAGWNTTLSICVVAGLVAIYTYSGGLAAVVYTDVLQGIIMIVGCLIITIAGSIEIGGWNKLEQVVNKSLAEQAAIDPASPPPEPFTALGATHFDLILPVDTPSPWPWPAILFGLLFVVSPAYWIGNQCIVQRSLAARSEYEAKASYVWGALLKNIIPVVIVLPGLIALGRYPRLENQDHALPRMVGAVLYPGFRGIFVAAFLAALMSSIDSYLNSATTLFTHDFYKRFWRPLADDRRLLVIGRTVTILLTVWSIFFAFVLLPLDTGVYSIFQTLLSFIQGPALAVLFSALLSRRANSGAAFFGFLVGVGTAVGLFLMSLDGFCRMIGTTRLFQRDDPFLYYSIWAFLASIVVIMIGSYLNPPEPEEKLKYVISRRRLEAAS